MFRTHFPPYTFNFHSGCFVCGNTRRNSSHSYENRWLALIGYRGTTVSLHFVLERKPVEEYIYFFLSFSLGVKAFTGPLSDHLKAHRAVMASCISFLAAALSCIYFIPDLSPPHAPPGAKDSHGLPATGLAISECIC